LGVHVLRRRETVTKDKRLTHAPYTMKGNETCPECGHTREVLYLEGEALPDNFDCAICGFSMHCSHYYESDVPEEVKNKAIAGLEEA